MQFDRKVWRKYCRIRHILCCLFILGATICLLNTEVFAETENILVIIFAFCIPFAVISIIYCVGGYFNDRHYRLWIERNELHYRSKVPGYILSPSVYTSYTVKEISHYKETSLHFIVYGKIEWTQSKSTYEAKKVKIPKMFSNMHLLRDYLDKNSSKILK